MTVLLLLWCIGGLMALFLICFTIAMASGSLDDRNRRANGHSVGCDCGGCGEIEQVVALNRGKIKWPSR